MERTIKILRKMIFEEKKSMNSKANLSTYKGLYYYIKNGEVIIAKGETEYKDKKLKIPNTIEGLKVTTIDEGCFQNNDYIEEVYIPTTINCINDFAFNACKNLERVYINHDIETVYPHVFTNSLRCRAVFGPKQTNEMYECFAEGTIIEALKRNSLNNNWTKNLNLRLFSRGNIITGFDFNYDKNKKEIIKYNNISYYLDSNDNAIICEVNEPNNCNINLPEEINGHKVIAIGSYAFFKKKYDSIIIPDTVKTIAAAAFFNVEFNYLKLPKELDYLNECFTFDNASSPLFRIKIKGEESCSNVIVMPEIIKNLDASLFTLRDKKYLLIFENKPKYADSYEYEYKILGSSCLYDKLSKSIYTIINNNAVLLKNLSISNSSSLPLFLGNAKLTSFSTTFITSFTDGFIEIDPTKNDDDDKIHYNTFIIPDNILSIVDLFDSRDCLMSNETLANSNIEKISGLKMIDPYIVSKKMKEISNIEGIVLIPKECNPKITNCEKVYYNFKNIIKDRFFTYLVSEENNSEYAIAIHVNTADDTLILYSKIRGISILGCDLTINTNIDNFTFNNRYIETDNKGFNINIGEGSVEKVTFETPNVISDINKYLKIVTFSERVIFDNLEIILDKKQFEPLEDINLFQLIFYNSLKKVGAYAIAGPYISHIFFNGPVTLVKNAINEDIDVIMR